MINKKRLWMAGAPVLAVVLLTWAFWPRPTEVETLLGDASKARDKLSWVPEVSAQSMCAEMVASDLDDAKRAALLKQHGYSVNVTSEN